MNKARLIGRNVTWPAAYLGIRGQGKAFGLTVTGLGRTGVSSGQENGKVWSVASTVRFRVDRKDDGGIVICEAQNQALPSGHSKQTQYVLDVQCKWLRGLHASRPPQEVPHHRHDLSIFLPCCRFPHSADPRLSSCSEGGRHSGADVCRHRESQVRSDFWFLSGEEIWGLHSWVLWKEFMKPDS